MPAHLCELPADILAEEAEEVEEAEEAEEF